MVQGGQQGFRERLVVNLYKTNAKAFRLDHFGRNLGADEADRLHNWLLCTLYFRVFPTETAFCKLKLKFQLFSIFNLIPAKNKFPKGSKILSMACLQKKIHFICCDLHVKGFSKMCIRLRWCNYKRTGNAKCLASEHTATIFPVKFDLPFEIYPTSHASIWQNEVSHGAIFLTRANPGWPCRPRKTGHCLLPRSLSKARPSSGFFSISPRHRTAKFWHLFVVVCAVQNKKCSDISTIHKILIKKLLLSYVPMCLSSLHYFLRGMAVKRKVILNQAIW